MKIEVGRFKKDGRLKATTRHEEQDSNFLKSNLTECLRYDDKKLEVEVLLMVDWWNSKYHEDFERLWNLLVNILKKREK